MMSRLATIFLVVGFGCLLACAPVAMQSSEPHDLLPSAKWSGDYPVAGLGLSARRTAAEPGRLHR